MSKISDAFFEVQSGKESVNNTIKRDGQKVCYNLTLFNESYLLYSGIKGIQCDTQKNSVRWTWSVKGLYYRLVGDTIRIRRVFLHWSTFFREQFRKETFIFTQIQKFWYKGKKGQIILVHLIFLQNSPFFYNRTTVSSVLFTESSLIYWMGDFELLPSIFVYTYV